MTTDCLPPHARSLPLSDEQPDPYPDLQRRIAALEGLLETTRRDRQALRDELLRVRAMMGQRP